MKNKLYYFINIIVSVFFALVIVYSWVFRWMLDLSESSLDSQPEVLELWCIPFLIVSGILFFYGDIYKKNYFWNDSNFRPYEIEIKKELKKRGID